MCVVTRVAYCLCACHKFREPSFVCAFCLKLGCVFPDPEPHDFAKPKPVSRAISKLVDEMGDMTDVMRRMRRRIDTADIYQGCLELERELNAQKESQQFTQVKSLKTLTHEHWRL